MMIDVAWAHFMYDAASTPPPCCLHSHCSFTRSPCGSFPPVAPTCRRPILHVRVVVPVISPASLPLLSLSISTTHPPREQFLTAVVVGAGLSWCPGGRPSPHRCSSVPPHEQLLAAAVCSCWHTGLPQSAGVGAMVVVASL